MTDIKIVDFERQYAEAVITLVEANVPNEASDMETVRNSFEIIADWVDNKLEDLVKIAVIQQEKINIDKGLYYVVAIDATNTVVGVSGVYFITEGYLEKLGFPCNDLVKQEIETDASVWIGWTAVSKKLQKQGIGKFLIQTALSKVRCSKYWVNVKDLMVIADKDATGFYEKLGMKHIITLRNMCIYSMAITDSV